MTSYIEFDRKVIIPRMRILTPPGGLAQKVTFDWAPPAWKSLKQMVAGEASASGWSKIFESAKNARMLISEKAENQLGRVQHMQLKSMYVMLQEGYIIRDADGKIATFRRCHKKGRITKDGTILVSTPFRNAPNHAIAQDKIRTYLDNPQVNFTFKPLAVAYNELTFEDGKYGPAYFWLLHEATPDRKLPKRATPHPDEDSFVGMKNADALRLGNVTLARQPLRFEGKMDQIVLNHLHGIHTDDPRCRIRRLALGEYATMPHFDKKLVDEYLKKRLSVFGALVGGGVLGWTVTSDVAHLDWLYTNLTKALETISVALF